MARCPLYYNGRILPIQGRTVLAHQKVHFQPLLCSLGRLGDARRGQNPVRAECNIPTPAIYYFFYTVTVRNNNYPAMWASEKIRYVSAYLTDIMPTVCVPVA